MLLLQERRFTIKAFRIGLRVPVHIRTHCRLQASALAVRKWAQVLYRCLPCSSRSSA
jgi:hypothetical protein